MNASLPKNGIAIKLIITDVDGTFLPKTRTLTPRTHEALRLLAEHNIPVVLASSRPVRGMQFILEEAGFLADLATFASLPVVSMNGALITTVGGATLFSSDLEAAILQRIYTLVADLANATHAPQRLNVMLLDAAEWWSSGVDDLVRREQASLRIAPIIAESREEKDAFLRRLERSANKVTLLGEAEAISIAKERIYAEFGDTLAISSPFNPRFLDITAQNVHKGTAVSFVGQYFGIETQYICALGDGENDVDMFRVAGTSIAMGHASDAVKEAAIHRTESHSEDGWANAIFRLFS
ncbi:MAG: HAD family phosphatase [Candidatus Kapaibacterium sp.]|nr:MAG: HAD family phosphatase [Candidatus Kapabacteria bacterium]